MEETTQEISESEPSGSSIETSPSICVVCGDVAKYSYYGAVVCQSCKVFFRRNAGNRSIPLICHYDNHCEINKNSRHTCACCRLAKCFSTGLNADLIRSQRTKRNKSQSTSKALARSTQNNQHQQIRPLNLLERDQSTLNEDQWNNISNLVHSFDEHNGYSFIRNFIDEQTSLPPKFRFKSVPVNDFYYKMMSNVQLVFEKNRNSALLSSDDRSLILRSTVECTTNMGGAFQLKQFQLFDFPDFVRSTELIFPPTAMFLLKRLIEQLDPDITFIKIIFGLMSFLISNYTVYNNKPPNHFQDTKKIISTQDMYTELVWRYLIYKHNYQDAILCFSNFLRCLFLLNDSIAQAHDAQQYTNIMDSIVQSTEEKLHLNQ